MPRPTRIRYENAFYHVMNRGRERQTIFHGPDYYSAFLTTLGEAHARFDAQFHAYCLMGNHYHLLIETPRANLDRIMRHINGVYTQRHNRLKHTDGPLFRGRYKAILVDEDTYLLQVGRYIHRNPAETKGSSEKVLERFQWSSYLAYIRQAPTPTWLQRETTYQMLGHHRHRYKAYRAFVERGSGADFLKFYTKGNIANVLADREFRETVAEKRDQLQVSSELSKVLSDRPSMSAIVDAVSQVFKITSQSITTKHQGRPTSNLPRQIAMYYCQQWGDHSLNDIAIHFGLTHSGSVSGAVAAVKKRVLKGEFGKEFLKLEKLLYIIK